MKRGLYARLAWTGMVKNKRLYLPYGLSAAGMVLMFYILTGLSGRCWSTCPAAAAAP